MVCPCAQQVPLCILYSPPESWSPSKPAGQCNKQASEGMHCSITKSKKQRLLKTWIQSEPSRHYNKEAWHRYVV
eukprot:scaffold9236_cov26-Tisochrysis_lutea.AAC.1